MKNFAIVLAATVLVASLAATVKAGDVPKSTLNSMGLGSVQQMSDTDGLTVRGKGSFAVVWGQSTATFPGATSTNGYLAGAAHNHGSSYASGSNVSYAGATLNVGHFNASLFVVAGGSSSAYAR